MSARAQLGDTIEPVLAESCPCDACRRRERCASGYACSAFVGFFRGDGEPRWRSFPRVPRAEIYAALFEIVLHPPGGGRPRKSALRAALVAT